MATMIGKKDEISEGQAGFRPNRSCTNHLYALGKITQGGKDAGFTPYCCVSIDMQKAYAAVWRNGQWKKLREIGIRGNNNMWILIECARSAVMLDRDISKYVDILRGVAQGCTLSPTRVLYLRFILATC